MDTAQRERLTRLVGELGGALETRYGVAEVLGENAARLVRMAEIASAAVPHAQRTLDVGVNLGYTAALLRTVYPEPAEVVGLEHPSRELFDDDRWRKLVGELAVQVVGGDARCLPFPDRSFDVVVAGEILEHLSPESLTTEFLPGVRRVLRPGGVLVLSTPNLACLLNRVLFVAWGRTSMDLPVPREGRDLRPPARVHARRGRHDPRACRLPDRCDRLRRPSPGLGARPPPAVRGGCPRGPGRSRPAGRPRVHHGRGQPGAGRIGGGAVTAVTPIFVVGSPRSGTTLMGRYVGSSPRVCDLGEYLGFYLAHHVAEREFRDMPSPFAEPYLAGLHEFTAHFAADLSTRDGCDFYCDDTPWNLLVADALVRRLPGAVFVLMLRHYSGAVQSLQRSYAAGYRWAGSTPEESAALWARFYSCTAVLPQRRTIPVSYDRLVRKPEPTLRRLHERLREVGLDERYLDLGVFTVSHATKPQDAVRPLSSVDAAGNVVLGRLPSFRADEWPEALDRRVRAIVHPVERQLIESFGRSYRAPAGFLNSLAEEPADEEASR